MKKEIIITSATRTAVGSLGKSLKNISGAELGSAVITECIKKSKIKSDEVDEVVIVTLSELKSDLCLIG